MVNYDNAISMQELLKKLNYKGQPVVHVLRMPWTLAGLAEAFGATAEVHRAEGLVKDARFALAFCTKQAEVDAFARWVAASAASDALVWVAYPKGSSKAYQCEFNRDTGWAEFGAQGFEPVRQVALDEDWSALRLRRVEHIQKMTRSFALTAEGAAKARKGRAAAKKKAAKKR